MYPCYQFSNSNDLTIRFIYLTNFIYFCDLKQKCEVTKPKGLDSVKKGNELYETGKVSLDPYNEDNWLKIIP